MNANTLTDDSEAFQKSEKRPRSMGIQSHLTASFVGKVVKLATLAAGMDVTVHNQQAVPQQGPVILVSNHESIADPAFLAATIPRNGAIMAKHDLWRVPILGTLLRLHGAIPVYRESDEARDGAKQKGKNVLAHGGLLALFGAGTTNRIGQNIDWRIGFAEMATEFNATINVVRFEGTARFLPRADDCSQYGLKKVDRRQSVKVIYSEPITPQIYSGMSHVAIKNMCMTINRDLAVPPRLL